MGIGTTEILIICGVIVFIFGASTIPKLARSLGKAKNEFEKGLTEKEDGDPVESEQNSAPKDDSTKE